MRQFLFVQKELTTNVSLTLELNEGEEFRFIQEYTDAFGMEEIISTGNYIESQHEIVLNVTYRYRYSKYLTDLNPQEDFSDLPHSLLLPVQASDVLFNGEQGAFLLTLQK